MGHRLQNYHVLRVLGVGGFGVTYLAEHATLAHKVAIKEYLPNEFALRDGATVYPKSEADREDFEWGLARFLDEARTLVRFEHRNLVRVRDYFEANQTAYIVMDYEDGEPLDRLLENLGTLTEAQLRRILLPIVEGLREVHAAGYLHRDIKPSNIFVRRADESPVLLDFGAARQALGRKSKSMTAVASVGYSPPEQYESEGEQGPWSDIYALAALCYRAITGTAPVEAPRRLNRLAQRQPDPLPRLSETTAEGYSMSLLEAVDQGLEVIAADRPRNLDDWVTRLADVSTSEARRTATGRKPGAAQADMKKLTGARRGKARNAGLGVAALAVAAVFAVAVWTLQGDETPQLPGGSGRDAMQPLTHISQVRQKYGHQLSGYTDEQLAQSAYRFFNADQQLDFDTFKSSFLAPVPDATPAPRPAQLNHITQVRQTFGNSVSDLTDEQITRAAYRRKFPNQDQDFDLFKSSFLAPVQDTPPVTPPVSVPSAPAPPPDLLMIGGSAILVVETEPAGAEVLVGGEVVGETPLTIRNVRPGTHPVTLRHPHYQTVLLEEQTFAEGEVLRVERTLEAGVGKLTVLTQPGGAWIERDGERLAETTPLTLDGLPAGPLELTLGAEEHRPVRVQVEVPMGGVALLERTLERIPHGTLTLELAPPDAAVILPDIAPAYRPGMRLPEGEHRVKVRRSGYREVTRNVEVSGDTRERIELELDPQPFTVVATPATAAIAFVDAAESYRPGMRLAPGDYRVHVSAPEYEPIEETIRHRLEPTRYGVTLVRSGPQPGDTFMEDLRSGSLGPEMVVLPAGRFRMGCVSGQECYVGELPVHEVTIAQPFALSKYEVTFARWDACVSGGGCNGYRPNDNSWGRGSRPVMNVNWQDAQSYVAWLSRETGADYRLPSEAEWEYAVRAGTVTKYSWGNDIGQNRANCDSCGRQWKNWLGQGRTAPVGSFAANAWGLHDMHGNVYEWTQDCVNMNYYGAPGDGSAWEEGDCAKRIVRGGSWFPETPRSVMSSAYRGIPPSVDGRFVNFGFRVARTLTP